MSDVMPDNWLDTTNLVRGEYVRWSDVQVGWVVKIDKQHGPVVEANVDPLFCSHRFDDGTIRARNRDLEVAIERDLTDDEKADWIAKRQQQWDKYLERRKEML